MRFRQRAGLLALVLVCTTAPGGRSLAATTLRTLYVPTSASLHGNAGTFFHTDLWAFNRSFTAPLTVTATYHCFAGPCSISVKTLTLGPRESKLFSDVGGALFQLPETAGAIELSYTSSSDDLAVTTRTYTPGLPSPTNGTSVPAYTLQDAKSRAVFLGLGCNGGNLASGFRTNAGAFFPAPAGFTTAVTYALYRGDGTLLGTTSQSLAAGAAGQINDVFLSVGAGSTVTTNAYLVLTSTHAVLPFVTVVDNQSGDSVFVAPADDQPAPPVTQLITNGGFDSGISSWINPVPSDITLAAAPVDADGTPGSGSLLVTNTRTDAHSGSGAEQCIAATSGSILNLSARVYIPSAQLATGLAEVQVFFQAGAGCTGAYTDRCVTTHATQVDQWVTLTGTCVVPAGSQSGYAMAFTSKAQGNGGFLVYFDDISVSKSAR